MTTENQSPISASGVSVSELSAQSGPSAVSRESLMVVIERNDEGTPTVWCDPEIVDLVTALNKGGIRTVASCSGHGVYNGNVALADGRELIIALNFEEARAMEKKLLKASPAGARDAASGLKRVLERLSPMFTTHDRGRIVAAIEALTGKADGGDADACPDDATNLEVIEYFIHVGRTMKPVGHWPGERLYSAIERHLSTPHRFIAEADKSPRREHNGRGGDEEHSLPPLKATRPAATNVGEDHGQEL